MSIGNLIRLHWAALRALLMLTVITGLAYPTVIWSVAQLPGLKDKADGSLLIRDGRLVGSSLIGQSFTDAKGHVLRQYFQSRPSDAGAGYDPLSSGAGNLGPESIVDTAGKPSLLTQVCTRSDAVADTEHLDHRAGARPFCTADGVGAVLSVTGPRDAGGNVTDPTRVVSVNQPCADAEKPFVAQFRGVPVECARYGSDYAAGQLVAIRGPAPAVPRVPADAVTASGSGLDPDISVAYADLQIPRVAAARGVGTDQIRALVAANTTDRTLGFMGEPAVNVVLLNLALDQKYPLGHRPAG